MNISMANIRLNALNIVADIVHKLDKEYREIDGKIYYLPDSQEKNILKNKLENVSKLRGKYKYKKFKIKNYMRKKNEYNETKAYT